MSRCFCLEPRINRAINPLKVLFKHISSQNFAFERQQNQPTLRQSMTVDKTIKTQFFRDSMIRFSATCSRHTFDFRNFKIPRPNPICPQIFQDNSDLITQFSWCFNQSYTSTNRTSCSVFGIITTLFQLYFFFQQGVGDMNGAKIPLLFLLSLILSAIPLIFLDYEKNNQ